MRKRHRLVAAALLSAAQVCAPPAQAQAPAAAPRAKTSRIREERPARRARAEAPAECLTAAREFIAYLFREDRDIADDKEAQGRWLSQHLRNGLANRREVYRKHKEETPETAEGPPDNGDFIGSWDYPTSYRVVGSRRYDRRALVDIVFKWGPGTNYAGDERLVSYVFVHEGGRWKLDDIYTFGGEFTAGAHSLSEIFWRKVYP